MKQLIAFLLILLMPFMVMAQEVEMADTMRSEGKIYVVVAIILVIFIGLISYLVWIDRKISRAEQRMAEKK